MVTFEQQLRDVDAVPVEVLDVATRADAKEKAGTRRDAYERALHEAREIAGREAAGELVEWIQERIRSEEEFPGSRQVRERGAKICRELSHPVPDDSWLGT